ncbi:MgtC/SapB family protein [Paenibacillus sp. VMFN-D1]|uniref:MgtC/SapB family protein n=1 Tax=Paenibacillus sp. VMFN-D1 TaxID=2135608 RepID=UPI000E25AC1F|nr:MgtC/SapB family protein [Paenibacillus sp. VMFN-D1]RED28972.1 putative Mg2+ transporter-C (MgtC) family protein [Paenibacillus sp. VMFN-D1]
MDLTLRLLLSVAMGGLIGMEREWNNHAAGFRTHILVCLGSASIMILSMYGFEAFVDETNVRLDPARLAAQVISGIGFLGAGAILRSGQTVSGLTTAASVWVVAAIGLSIGAGFLYSALLTTGLAFISLFALNKWEKLIMHRKRNFDFLIRVPDKPGMLVTVASELDVLGIKINNIEIRTPEGLADAMVELKFHIRSPNPMQVVAAMDKISSLPDVLGIESSGISSEFAQKFSANNKYSNFKM